MSSLYLSHPHCQLHDMGKGHPESPDRLRVIEKMVNANDWNGNLSFVTAPKLDIEQLSPIHPQHHVKALMEMSPKEGVVFIDGDTSMNPNTIDAALYAAGAAVYATDEVIEKRADNAFCAVRPPGHHAESTTSMGFCIFNNVALAAQRALSSGMSRVAILDFDVHHGNGTVEIFQDRPEVLVCSSFQYPFYPGRYDQVVRPNVCLTPLSEGSDGSIFRSAIESQWITALHHHQPEMIFISAGFDAHIDDPLGGLNLSDEDYLWVTEFIKNEALKLSQGRIVSLLEGGYNLDALARSVKKHLDGLVD